MGLQEVLQHHIPSTHCNSDHRSLPSFIKAGRSPTIEITHASFQNIWEINREKEKSRPETTPVGSLQSVSVLSLE